MLFSLESLEEQQKKTVIQMKRSRRLRQNLRSTFWTLMLGHRHQLLVICLGHLPQVICLGQATARHQPKQLAPEVSLISVALLSQLKMFWEASEYQLNKLQPQPLQHSPQRSKELQDLRRLSSDKLGCSLLLRKRLPCQPQWISLLTQQVARQKSMARSWGQESESRRWRSSTMR